MRDLNVQYNKNDEELMVLFNDSNSAYYNTEEIILTDRDFDELKDYLLSKNLIKESVGVASTLGDDVTHRTKVLSQTRVFVDDKYTDEKHDEVLERINAHSYSHSKTAIFEWKYDGLQINLMYSDGVLVGAATRGDGDIGQDVFGKVKQLVPNNISNIEVSEIRCECVIRHSIFNEIYKHKYAHPRNLAVGIIKSDDLYDPRLNDLVIIPEDVMYTDGSTSPAPEFLNQSEFPIIKELEYTISHISYENFKENYDKMFITREKFDFPTDGIVVKQFTRLEFQSDKNNHHPSHCGAIKFPPPEIITEVKDIIFVTGTTGVVTPTLILKPVFSDGRKITKCHGYSWNFIQENHLGVGSVIRVELRGDIIPACVEILKQSNNTVEMPKNCVVDGKHLYSTDLTQVKEERFVKACEIVEFNDLGEVAYRNIAEFFDYNVANVFNGDGDLEQEHLVELIGESKAKKLKDRVIEIKKSGITLLKSIKMGVYRGIGDSTAELVANHFMGKKVDWKGKEMKHVDSMLSGEYKSDYDEMISILSELGIKIITEAKDGKRVVMTGTPKPFFNTKKAFTEFTGFVDNKSSFNGAEMLVCDDLTSTSSKMKKAKSKGIEIVTYESFAPKSQKVFNLK